MLFKYIANENEAIIFKNRIGGIQHNEVAKGLLEKGIPIDSAGIAMIDYDKKEEKFIASCSGSSLTLGLESKPERDKETIENMFNEFSL